MNDSFHTGHDEAWPSKQATRVDGKRRDALRRVRSRKALTMTSKMDIAAEKFEAGFNCAQSVVWAFCDELGLDKDLMLKLATGFGGGMGHQQETCGAITGAILVFGAKLGRGENDPRANTEATYAKVRELFARFYDRHGACLCSQLLPNCDLNTEAGRQKFKEQNLRETVCKECVRDAVRLVEELA